MKHSLGTSFCFAILGIVGCQGFVANENQAANTSNYNDTIIFNGTTISETIAQARQDILEIALQSLQINNVNMAAKFLRLAFHDSVGRANGCVDMSDPDNAGLDVPIGALGPIVHKYSAVLSRADVWALAGLVGTESLQNPNDPRSVTFPMYYYGRVDCDTVLDDGSVPLCNPLGSPVSASSTSVPCSDVTDSYFPLPSPDLSTRELLEYFRNTFGFSTRETVVAMGAHTVGVARRENSGFHGPRGWVDARNELDTEYYAQLVGGASVSSAYLTKVDEAPHWSGFQQNNEDLPNIPNRFVWIRRSQATSIDTGSDISLIMLNSDIALVRDLEGLIDPTTKAVECDFVLREDLMESLVGRCPVAKQLLEIAAELKHNITHWRLEFRDVLTKMFSTGYETAPSCNPDSTNTPFCLLLVDSSLQPPTNPPTQAPTLIPTTSPTPAPIPSSSSCKAPSLVFFSMASVAVTLLLSAPVHLSGAG